MWQGTNGASVKFEVVCFFDLYKPAFLSSPCHGRICIALKSEMGQVIEPFFVLTEAVHVAFCFCNSSCILHPHQSKSN